MGANITVVGGGSYHWAPRLLADFANTPSLNDAHVVLHDLDADRMKLMQELGAEIASRLFDCGMADIDPILGGVNHYPLATSLRVAGEDDGFVRLHALLGDPARAATEPIWMDPPERAGWVKVSPAEHWTKLDVIENNRVRFELFRRFGVLVGSGDHHSVEFMPSFVHERHDYGLGW